MRMVCIILSNIISGEQCSSWFDNWTYQIFATSHSWDAIEAFQQAAAEAPEMGVLIRLTRKAEDIIPTVFSEEELALVTRDRIEVR